MRVTRAGRQPCDPKYSRLAERIEALQAEIAALASELSVVSGNAGQAVVTAEDAQASAAVSAAEAGTARTAAEAAAATAQGASDRVTAAEAAIDDVQDYAEAIGDDVAAIDTEIHTTRPYVDTNSEQTITAKKHIPTATASDSSDVWVNKAFVQATDGRNNLLHNMGNESIKGRKECYALRGVVAVFPGIPAYGYFRAFTIPKTAIPANAYSIIDLEIRAETASGVRLCRSEVMALVRNTGDGFSASLAEHTVTKGVTSSPTGTALIVNNPSSGDIELWIHALEPLLYTYGVVEIKSDYTMGTQYNIRWSSNVSNLQTTEPDYVIAVSTASKVIE